MDAGVKMSWQRKGTKRLIAYPPPSQHQQKSPSDKMDRFNISLRQTLSLLFLFAYLLSVRFFFPLVPLSGGVRRAVCFAWSCKLEIRLAGWFIVSNDRYTISVRVYVSGFAFGLYLWCSSVFVWSVCASYVCVSIILILNGATLLRQC